VAAGSFCRAADSAAAAVAAAVAAMTDSAVLVAVDLVDSVVVISAVAALLANGNIDVSII
jgi:hypothetical protein